MDVLINKPNANTKDLTKDHGINDGTFGKLRLYKSGGFNLQDKEQTTCFTLQIRTIGTIIWNSKINRKITSNVDVSIADLREMLAYAEKELAR